MPFGPNFPFVPAGPVGIDDQDGLPNDWFVPANPGAVAPNNPNMPAPAAAPNPAPPAPNPQPSSATLGPSNQRAPPRPDPFAAFWALIPASRVGALAWAPPIFPSSNPFAFRNIPAPPPPFSLNSPRQFPSAGPAPFDDVPPAAANGLFGNTIGRLLAARAKPYDPFEAAANGMWGGIAKMIAANAAPDPGARGFLGSLADLPVPPSAQAASYAPYLGPFVPSDPIGFPAAGPRYPFLPSGLPAPADSTAPFSNQPPTDHGIAAGDTGEGNWRPNYLLVAGDEEDEKEHSKPDPAVLGGLTDQGLTAPPKVLPPVQLPLPLFPRPLPPLSSGPQPPFRPSLPTPSAPPSSALSPRPPGQGANSPRTSGTTIGPPPADAPTEGSEDDAGNRGGPGAGPEHLSSPPPIGDQARSPTPSEPDWQKLTEEINDALNSDPERLQAVISARLPKYDNKITYGVLITNEGEIVPLKSANADPLYDNYIPAGHVEGKAAVSIREHGSTGGVLYHNNTDGICGYCNSQVETLLPKGAELLVIPPADAVAKKRGAKQDPTPYVGNNEIPKLPRQYDLFRRQP
jgi:hypothetical protein